MEPQQFLALGLIIIIVVLRYNLFLEKKEKPDQLRLLRKNYKARKPKQFENN